MGIHLNIYPFLRDPLLRDFEGVNQVNPDSKDLSLSGNFKRARQLLG
jgi:hypothetical protein